MDGWEFLEKFRDIKDSLPQSPVIIMLSTSLNPDDKLKALSISVVSELCNKPMTSEMITSLIAKYFPQYR